MEMIHLELGPPEPQLLDTCVLQNLDWVDRLLESRGTVTWDEPSIAELAERYGEDLAEDLIALGVLYKSFEWRSGYPWLVCEAAVNEAQLLAGPLGERLRQMIEFLGTHQSEWVPDSYGGVAPGLLFPTPPTRVSPLILRGLCVEAPGDAWAVDGPLSFLPDEGDRKLATAALFANVPAVLTTDRRTFWSHRGSLMRFGLKVLRPTELLALYEPCWEAEELEFARRRQDARPPGAK